LEPKGIEPNWHLFCGWNMETTLKILFYWSQEHFGTAWCELGKLSLLMLMLLWKGLHW